MPKRINWPSVQVPDRFPPEPKYPFEWTTADQTAAHNDGWGVVTSWRCHISSHTDRMTNKQATLRVHRMAENGNKLCKRAVAYVAMRAIEDGGPID